MTHPATEYLVLRLVSEPCANPFDPSVEMVAYKTFPIKRSRENSIPKFHNLVTVSATSDEEALNLAIALFPRLRLSLCVQPKADYDALIARILAWKAAHPRNDTPDNRTPQPGPIGRSQFRRNPRIHSERGFVAGAVPQEAG